MERTADQLLNLITSPVHYHMVEGVSGGFGAVFHTVPLFFCPQLQSLPHCEGVFSLGELLSDALQRSLTHPLRISLMDLSLLDTEWTGVLWQHAALACHERQHGRNIPHLLLPTAPLFGVKQEESAVQADINKIYAALLAQFNAEALFYYCRWLGEDIAAILSRFQPEDSEEYQLQARLEDFLHEIRSTIFLDLWEQLRQSEFEEHDIMEKGDEKALKETEWVVVKCRTKIARLLEAQRDLLQLIDEGVDKIKAQHPELINLKAAAALLYAMMSPDCGWTRLLICAQLLDQLMGVVSGITAQGSGGRSLAIFAVRAALAELSARYPIGQLVEMCLSWDEGNRTDPLAEMFRQSVIEQAKEWRNRFAAVHQESSGDILGEWITFIPEKIFFKTKPVQGVLLVIDAQSGKALGGTSDGLRLLHRLMD